MLDNEDRADYGQDAVAVAHQLAADTAEVKADIGLAVVNAAASQTGVADQDVASTAIADVISYIGHFARRYTLTLTACVEEALAAYRATIDRAAATFDGDDISLSQLTITTDAAHPNTTTRTAQESVVFALECIAHACDRLTLDAEGTLNWGVGSYQGDREDGPWAEQRYDGNLIHLN